MPLERLFMSRRIRVRVSARTRSSDRRPLPGSSGVVANNGSAYCGTSSKTTDTTAVTVVVVIILAVLGLLVPSAAVNVIAAAAVNVSLALYGAYLGRRSH